MSTPEEAIRRTLGRYCMLCDDGRFEEWGQLFTEEAVFHVMGQSHTGRSNARAFIEETQPPELRGQHMTVNSVIQMSSDGTTARSWSDYVFFTNAGKMINRGRYHDELVLGPDGAWRLSLREIVFAGNDPEITSPPPARD